MANRKSIPDAVKLQLWTRAGGRCEFCDCNKPLWRDGLTLKNIKLGEMAHIIGASSDGPRGNDSSEELQQDFDNLMLLCHEHHKLVDSKPEEYPAEQLRTWKRQHEHRIFVQTSIHGTEYQTTILRFAYKIGERFVEISNEATWKAIAPKYPTPYPAEGKGILIEDRNFNRQGPPEIWEDTAARIQRSISSILENVHDGQRIKHLSIFALGPMPLLICLGKIIGDTIPCDIYQAHRENQDTNNNWKWPEGKEESNMEFQVIEKNSSSTDKDIALVMSLSDKIRPEQYSGNINDSNPIYEMVIENPDPRFLQSKKMLQDFSNSYRRILNHIEEVHGKDCKIHLFPAVPVSAAIEIGRVLIPTKDSEIQIYEWNKSAGSFKKVLKI